jgi:hypothetical protein
MRASSPQRRAPHFFRISDSHRVCVVSSSLKEGASIPGRYKESRAPESLLTECALVPHVDLAAVKRHLLTVDELLGLLTITHVLRHILTA